MSSLQSSAEDRLSVLLPYYLGDPFPKIYRGIGFEVFWADSILDTERIIMDYEPDLALEWQHGRFYFPVRDLLKKHKRSTPVILLLNWNSSLPDDTKDLGYAGYANPSDLKEIVGQFYMALPERKRHLLKIGASR